MCIVISPADASAELKGSHFCVIVVVVVVVDSVGY